MPVKIPQPHGGALNSSGTPGNSGGKPGRSGRKRDALKAKLESIADEAGVPFLESVLAGRVNLVGTCPACGWECSETDTSSPPSLDVRLRAAEMSLRYSIGSEKILRLDGVRGVAESFDAIRLRIRLNLPEDVAEALIRDIERDLRSIR